jgi:hypothetical protein
MFTLAEEPETYRFSAGEEKEILAAKREARKPGKLSRPFTSPEALITQLRKSQA